MNAHCGLWQRECDLNTRVMVSKTIALTAWLSRYIPTGSFEWYPAPYLKGEPQHEHLPHLATAWSEWWDLNSRPPHPKCGVLPTELHPDLVAGLFILSPAIRVEEHYLSLYLVAPVRSCLLTSCIVSWLYRHVNTFSKNFWNIFYTQLIRKCKQIW